MFPRIVVATDMSEYAGRAERRAAMLARELGSESLDLLYVMDSLALESLRHLTLPPLDTEQRLMESSRTRMTGIEHQLSENYRVPVATTTLNVGRPHTEIVRYAGLVNAGMVVIGAHGGGFIQDLFVGSMVDKVLCSLNCPLLIVKREPQVPYHTVLVPVDFSKSSRRGLEMASDIAPHGNITVLHAFEVPFEAELQLSDKQVLVFREEVRAQRKGMMEQMAAGCRLGASLAPSVSHVIEWGTPAAVIHAAAESLNPDLIIVGKRGQSGGEDKLPGTVAKQVIRDAPCDVLITGVETA
jgi:nucleotide-binding universal stress UspA family protein